MAVDGIQSISSSSVSGLLFQALAASGAFSVSQSTQNRLSSLEAVESTMATRLTDLAVLRGLLKDLTSAAAGLRRAPTTTGSNINAEKTDGTTDRVKFDVTEAANLTTGDRIIFQSDLYGATANTAYFVRVVNTDANTKDVELYTTRTDALNGTGTRVNITTTDNSISGKLANEIIPEPQEQIEALFDAYNQLQDFITEQRETSGSLANEKLLSSLGSQLLETLKPALESSSFSPAVSLSGTSRQVTIDESVLATKISNNAITISSIFDENGNNVADSLRQVGEFFTSVVDTLAHTLDEQTLRVTQQTTSLLEQSQQEQATGFANIGKIASAISLSQIRAQFLSTL